MCTPSAFELNSNKCLDVSGSSDVVIHTFKLIMAESLLTHYDHIHNLTTSIDACTPSASPDSKKKYYHLIHKLLSQAQAMTAHLKATLSNAVDLELTDYVDEDEDGEGDAQGEAILPPLWPLHKDDTLSRSGRSTDLNIYF